MKALHPSSSGSGSARGIVWALFAALALTFMLMLVKLIGQSVPTSQILAIRQSVMVVLALPAVAINFPHSLSSKHLGLHLLRSLMATLAMMAGYTAVAHLPLADFTALSFSRALFITIFAIIFLREVVDRRRWLATIIGFVGVLIVLQPSIGPLNHYGLLAIFGAACMAGIAIIIRTLTFTDRPITILTYQALLVGMLIAPLAALQWVPMTFEQWMIAIGVGITGALTQAASISALRATEVSAVAPIDYTRLVWAVILGLVVFAQVPSFTTVIGATVIVLATYIVCRQETVGTKRH